MALVFPLKALLLLDKVLTKRPIAQMSVYEARQSERIRRRRHRLLGAYAPMPMDRIEDHWIPVDGGNVQLRVYKPISTGELPIVMYFHGGGFVLGNIGHNDRFCRWLAHETNSIVAAVGYRQAPEFKFPTALEDAFAATCWMATYADKFWGNPGKIAVMGEEAGGNLAAALSRLVVQRGGPRLRQQILICPWIDFTMSFDSVQKYAKGYGLTYERLRYCQEQYLSSPSDVYNPMLSLQLEENIAELAPTLVITAQYDPLRDEGVFYANQLKKAGVEVKWLEMEEVSSGFMHFPKLVKASREAMKYCHTTLKQQWALKVGF